MLLLFDFFGIADPFTSNAERDLATRVESIPIEQICDAIVSGRPIPGQDHAAVWHDGTSYVVGGWVVESNGNPVFYWRGADLPEDEPNCGR